MHKSIYGFIIGLMISMSAFSQTTFCGTDYFLEKEYAKNPSFQNEVEQNWMLSDGPVETSARGARAVKIIPVVFHVFHSNGVGNISYEQLLSGIQMLNEDFRRTNSDSALTRNEFKPFAVDSEIEFRLAKVDPDGNCTNGVVRINNSEASYDADDNVKPLSRWPSDQYFNIWVVNTIESGGVSGTILGYAQFPGSGAWNTYGIVIRNDRVGSIETATSQDRTLTHEVGHCLNLLHTFQSGCGNTCQSSGDRVCDTPPVSFSTQTCDKSQNQCSNDASGNSVYNTDVKDQIENYMSYNDCQNMYSAGQKTRMQNALTNISTLVQLVSTNNLNYTGVLNTDDGICEVEFDANNTVICTGQNVQFTDHSFFNPQSYQWTFEGGEPHTSTDKNPLINFTKPGTYQVELTITDSFNDSKTSVKSNYITVLNSFGNTTPTQELFESANQLNDIEWSGDYLESGFNWGIYNGSSASGTKSAKAQAYDQKGRINLYSKAYDASNLKSGSLSFKYAYSPKTGEGANYINIQVSNDCGQTWTNKSVLGGALLQTTTPRNSEYKTPNSSDWKTKTISLDSNELSLNVRFRFEYVVDYGNNLFIDDIQFYGTLSDSLHLKWPENGSQSVSASPTLNWNATSVVDYYFVELATDSLFNNPNVITEQLTYINSSSHNIDTEFKPTNLIDGQTYYWRVRTNLNGVDTAFSEVWNFKVDASIVGVENQGENLIEMNIFPNPAHDILFIKLNTNREESISINLYSSTGVLVQEIENGVTTSNENVFEVDAKNLSHGVYFVRFTSQNETLTKRVIIGL